MNKNVTLHHYFQEWITIYKKPFVSTATYVKYTNTHRQIIRYFGDITVPELTATYYQQTLNDYAKTHSKLTVSCFHKQIRACLLDAIDESIISKDPSRKAMVTGRNKPSAKNKYLDYRDWQALVQRTYGSLNIKDQVIYLSAVTGMRYAEVLGLTWDNIHFDKQYIEIDKTWDYKYHQGFISTKNHSSNRRVDIDQYTVTTLRNIFNKKSSDNEKNLVFHYTEGKQLYSANINQHLSNLCSTIGIPEISFHSLRHTHASVMLYQGISIMAVSKRLGHSNVTTTQEVYIHIIKEMQERERDCILQAISKVFDE